jgi:hypothetical protein
MWITPFSGPQPLYIISAFGGKIFKILGLFSTSEAFYLKNTFNPNHPGFPQLPGL